ncbi:MAG: hypothetical protein SPK50_09765 [Mobiluncus porci]|uniref:hypothetical protein n=1 Tax=Mobiluncus porci TaxID=2652278 RepID=UPI0023EF582E|nr:hypothetical protein [Mobiluncus porci]MDD7542054.1 hypothetical protein [Mobiluncus porci]MDY5749397.1 hypothetical protein [Mobiluncus porci]
MRTTVTLDDDVLLEIDRIRAGERLGLSDALNTLARRGIGADTRHDAADYSLPTFHLGVSRLDLQSTGELLDYLDEVDFGEAKTKAHKKARKNK